MKKTLVYIALVIFSFIVSCKRDEDPIFDDPDTRLSAELAANQSLLISPADGWKATIYPKGGKGFSFYFKFSADGKVDMLADINTASATALQTSTYRVKALQRPTLIFDTYNYIHLVADPDASISGGSNASGLKSDFEFAFAGSAGDTLKFEGTFNGNKMEMIKLTNAEATKILAGGLKTMVDDNAQYLATNRYPYLQFTDGKKTSIAIDPFLKTVKLSYIDNNDVSQTQSVAFSFGINKIALSSYLKYGTISFREILWDQTLKIYYIMSGTTRIEMQNSPNPLTPLTLLFGYPSTFTYRKITIPSTGLPVGVTSGFNTVYTSMVNLFVNSGRTVTSTVLTLTSNNTLTVDVNYATTSAFVATASYTYTRVGDTFTLSAPVYSANWTTRATQLLPLTNFLESGPFKINWVSSSIPTNTSTMGGFYRVADPTSFFYGTM